MQRLDVIDIGLLTIGLLVKRYLKILDPIQRQHLLPLKYQILHIHITILEIPLYIQCMRQLVLNDCIRQEPYNSIQFVDLKLYIIESWVYVDHAVVL